MNWLKYKLLALLAIVGFCLLPAVARADVRDNAHIFSQDAITKANTAMTDMERRHNKQFVVETFASVPDDMKAQLEQLGKEQFFKQWMASRAKELKVNGVYSLICMDPKYIEVGAGKETRARGDFTSSDIDQLRKQMQTAFHNQQYDQGLLQAVESVERAYTANINSGVNRSTGAYNNNSGAENQPSGAPYPSFPGPHSGGTGFGSLVCLGIGALVIFSLIRSIFRSRSGGYGGGYGGYGQNYPPNAGYGGPGYGGGGGGFGRGLLGGVLGGMLGGYAADKFSHRNDNSGSGSAGSSGGMFGGGGGGGGFDSGPSDAGQGFGDSSSGGDFGSSGGGGDGGGGGGGGDSGGGF